MKTGPGGHILTGPIYVEGADSGDVLEVRFKSIELAIAYAYNSFGPRSGFLPEDFPGDVAVEDHPARHGAMLGHFAPGITIPLHPFFGSVGVAPPASMGAIEQRAAGHPRRQPRQQGAGRRHDALHPGAGPRARCSRSATGTPARATARWTSPRSRRRSSAHVSSSCARTCKLTWPRGETPTHYIAMGTDSALVKATKTAVRQAIEFLVDVKHLTRDDAYLLVSVSSDVDITQLVDGTVGVHVMIPKAIFTNPR